MSEVRRPCRVSSDFSIARILAQDRSDALNRSETNAQRSKDNERLRGVRIPDPRCCKINSEHTNECDKLINDRVQCSLASQTRSDSLAVDCGACEFARNCRVVDCARLSGEESSVRNSGNGYASMCHAEENAAQLQCYELARNQGQSQSQDTVESTRIPKDPSLRHGNISSVIQTGELSWLQCTRYRPPRLPRKSASKTAKRRPGAHPRIPFTVFQLQVLEDKYKRGAYLSRRDVSQLSAILRLPQSRVKIWFQNRRARERRESQSSGASGARHGTLEVVEIEDTNALTIRHPGGVAEKSQET